MRYCKNCGNELLEEAKFCPRCGTAVVTEEPAATVAQPVSPAAPVSPAGVKMAYWLERFVAWLIDVFLIGVVAWILGLFVSFPLGFTFLPSWLAWIPFFNLNLDGVLLFLYWLFMESIYGQSLGKMFMRIKVTRIDGSPVSAKQAALESIGKAFFLVLDVLIGWIIYPRSRQRVFNYLSQTIVIKVT
jgi:uncharacterized RDD family membrane protein YckC